MFVAKIVVNKANVFRRSMNKEQQHKCLQRMRGRSSVTIARGRLVLYIATAVAFAASAADFAGNAAASALGNLGLLLIMVRLYILMPVAVCRAYKGEKRWLNAEYDYIREFYPWTDGVGRFGRMLLVASVLLQIFLGLS